MLLSLEDFFPPIRNINELKIIESLLIKYGKASKYLPVQSQLEKHLKKICEVCLKLKIETSLLLTLNIVHFFSCFYCQL